MRTNYYTILIGSKTILIPYRPEHVEKYHKWMKSPFLLEMTGSEPLSLEEEIKMQLSWRDDKDKCTFIVLARSECSSCKKIIELDTQRIEGEEEQQENQCEEEDGFDEMDFTLFGIDDISNTSNDDVDFVNASLNAMIGDVNLFLSEIEEDYEEEDQEKNKHNEKTETDEKKRDVQAELDVMIAEESFRREGMGKEASLMMMLYGAKTLGIRRFIVKIKEDNVASRALFERLGFHECNYAACFKEYELQFQSSSAEEMVKSIQAIYGNKMYRCKIK